MAQAHTRFFRSCCQAEETNTWLKYQSPIPISKTIESWQLKRNKLSPTLTIECDILTMLSHDWLSQGDK